MSTPAVVLEAARERRRRFASNNVLVIACGTVIAVAVFLAIFGPLLAPHDPNAANLANAYVGPVAGHALGYDSQGRDLLSRLLTGARTSIAGPFLVVLFSMVAGSVLAVTAAWAGRLGGRRRSRRSSTSSSPSRRSCSPSSPRPCSARA